MSWMEELILALMALIHPEQHETTAELITRAERDCSFMTEMIFTSIGGAQLSDVLMILKPRHRETAIQRFAARTLRLTFQAFCCTELICRRVLIHHIHLTLAHISHHQLATKPRWAEAAKTHEERCLTFILQTEDLIDSFTCQVLDLKPFIVS